MTPVVLKPRAFNNLGGMTRVFPTPSSLRNRSNGLPHYSRCDIRIALPPDRQLASAHPDFIKRLRKDWNNSLSSLACSTGDFGAALEAGEVSLSHVWAEIYCLWLDHVSVRLRHGHIHFAEQFKPQRMGPKATETRVWLFYSDPFPAEFGGLEYAVTGYLNALIEGRPYNLRERLDQFIVYRTNDDQPIRSRRRRKRRTRRQPQPISSGR